MKQPVDLSGTDDALVAMFTSAAHLHGVASDAGEYRQANKHYDVANAVQTELRRRGITSLALLTPLLDDGDPWVRYWAATAVRDIARKDAEAVLADLIRARPTATLALDATLVMQEWRKQRNG